MAGSGVVEAESENIAIGSPLPGVVVEVYVPVEQVGKIVKKGDPLFLIDTRQLKAQLKYYQASLRAAEAQVKKLELQPRVEEIPPAEAKVSVARANVELQRDLAERTRRLIATRSVSEEDYRQRALTMAVAQMQLVQAQSEEKLIKAGAWEPDKAIARANVALVKAQIEQTKTDLERSLVRAPMDGKVLQVNVRTGEFAGAPPSQALIVLGSVKSLHVRVDIDEHDIPRLPLLQEGCGRLRLAARRPRPEMSAVVCARAAVCRTEEVADGGQHRARRYTGVAGDLPRGPRRTGAVRGHAGGRLPRHGGEDVCGARALSFWQDGDALLRRQQLAGVRNASIGSV